MCEVRAEAKAKVKAEDEVELNQGGTENL